MEATSKTEKTSFIKIIFFGNFPFGGPSANLVRNFAMSLTENKNNQLEIILPTGNCYGKTDDIESKRKAKFGSVNYRYMSYKNHPKNIFAKIFEMFFGVLNTLIYLIICRIKERKNITIFYNTEFSFPFLLLSKLLNNKFIFILPEFYEKPNSDNYAMSGFKWKIFYFHMKHIIKYADRFFVASYYLKDYIQNTLKSKKEVYVLPNVIDPSIFELENIKPFKENIITIGYTGNPTRKDGILDLIKSFSILNKKFPNTHLLVIGDRTNGESLVPQLLQYATENGSEKNITFTGLVAFSKIPELLNSCQILALTRPNGVFAEAGFPTKLGEYFSCKKPVLITKVGDIPRYFTNHEQVVLADPENIESIVKGFEAIITDNALSNRLGLSGYKWMNDNLNYLNISKKISDFISA
ncbi:MAG: glycosyltransferase [Bacteroidota bacterium]